MSSAEVELVSSKSKGGDGSDTTKVGDATEKSAREVWPEASVSWLSSLLYLYIEPLLARGAIPGKTLGPEDLYAVPENETAAALVSVFRERYDELTAEAKRATEEAEAAAEASGAPANTKMITTPFQCVTRALWVVVRPLMLEGALHNFAACTCQVLQMLLLRALVRTAMISDSAESARQGLIVSAEIAVTVAVQAVCTQRQLHLAMRSGLRMRAVVCAEVSTSTSLT